MHLYTECFWEGWDRIVDIYVDKYGSLPEYVNDGSTYKIIALASGAIQAEINGTGLGINAPALILLSQKDRIMATVVKEAEIGIVFFKPSVIRDEFTYGYIDSGELENTLGQTIYQDYLLIRSFAKQTDHAGRIIPLSLSGISRIRELLYSLAGELGAQRDGYWPCRSRSYLMELLYFVAYSYNETGHELDYKLVASEYDEFSRIVEYLNEHIEDKITLDTLTRESGLNRNKLNALFLKKTSKTCLDYLLELRIELAKIMLTKTELPIGEISARRLSGSELFREVIQEQHRKNTLPIQKILSLCRFFYNPCRFFYRPANPPM